MFNRSQNSAKSANIAFFVIFLSFVLVGQQLSITDSNLRNEFSPYTDFGDKE